MLSIDLSMYNPLQFSYMCIMRKFMTLPWFLSICFSASNGLYLMLFNIIAINKLSSYSKLFISSGWRRTYISFSVILSNNYFDQNACFLCYGIRMNNPLKTGKEIKPR